MTTTADDKLYNFDYNRWFFVLNTQSEQNNSPLLSASPPEEVRQQLEICFGLMANDTLSLFRF